MYVCIYVYMYVCIYVCITKPPSTFTPVIHTHTHTLTHTYTLTLYLYNIHISFLFIHCRYFAFKDRDSIHYSLQFWVLCFISERSYSVLTTMRAPSLFTQCLPGLVHHDRVAHSMSIVSDKDVHLPSPAVEILPSKVGYPYRYAGDIIEGVNLFKGRVSVSDIIGSELISSKPDASPKCWDSSLDLVNILKHEIRDGQLSFRGKRVLQLSCGYGIPGIFACLKGASTVHFQDLNAEAVRCTTIPNVLANLEQARERQSRQPEGPLTPSRQAISPVVHFYAGEWEELSGVLSLVKNDVLEASPRMNLSFSEEDFLDARSSHDGSITGQDTSSRRSGRLSGSRVWESANDSDIGGGYDVILMTDIPHSATSLKKLYGLIKKCLKPPYGVLFVATKKHFVGFNNAARQLRSLVDDEGIFGAHLVKEISDTEIWKISLK